MNQDESTFFEKLTQLQTDKFLNKVQNRRVELEDIQEVPKSLNIDKLSADCQKHWEYECKVNRYSIWMLIINQFINDIFYQGFFWVLVLTTMTAMPMLIYYILQGLDFLSTMNLFILLGALVITLIVYLLSLFHVMHESNIMFLKIKQSIMTLIQDKTIQNKAVQNEAIGHGKILNVMSAELEKIMGLTMFYHLPWVSILAVLINGYLLEMRVGLIPAIAGMIWCFLTPFATVQTNNIWKHFKNNFLLLSDVRTNLVDQFVKGIVTIKALLMESFLAQKIKEIRAQEWVQSIYSHIFLAINNSLIQSLPQVSLMSLFGFQTFYQKVESISIYDVQYALMILSNLKMVVALWLNQFLKSQVSCDQSFERVKDLLIDGLEHELVQNITDTSGDIIISDYSAKFKLTDNTNIFHGLNVTFAGGQVHIISGSVGSGKSTLLLSILNEMQTTQGSIRTPREAKTVFCSQDPWIMHESLLSNILMEKDLDDSWLQKCIDLTQLEHDIHLLQEGIHTEIGDNGVNLSGGQKSRVQLCRVLQSNADVQVLDDPFSSLDPIVGQKIFEDVILKHLKGKTVILVTHQIAFFRQACSLTFLKDGEVAAHGKQDELSEQIAEHYTELVEKDKVEVAKEASASVDKTKKFETIVKVEQKSGNDIGFFKSIQGLQSVNGIPSIITVVLIMASVQQLQNQVDFFQIEFSENPQAKLMDLVIISLASVALVYGRSLMVLIQTNFATFSTFDRMLDSVANAKQEFFISNPSGRIINRFTKDAYELDELLLENLDFVQRLMLLIGGMIVSVIINAPQILIIIPFQAVVMYQIVDIQEQTSLQIKDIDSRTKSPVNTRQYSDLRGSVHLKASNSLNKNKKQWYELLRDNIKTQNVNQDAQRWFSVRLDFVTFISLLFLLIIGILARDQVNHAIISFCISQMYQIMALVQLCYRMMTISKQFLISYDRMNEYCNLEPEETQVKSLLTNTTTNSKYTNFQLARNDIKVTDLSVRYRSDLPQVLHSICFECKMQNAKIGIVGRTGSGKSSLLLSLLRMNQPLGSIQVGDLDLLNLGVHEARSYLAYIPQEPFLVKGTLRTNLDPFSQHSDEELVNILLESKLYESLTIKEEIRRRNSTISLEALKIPGEDNVNEVSINKNALSATLGDETGIAQSQLDMEIALNGMNLSMGQRQLVAMIRAVLRRAPVVLLDEATANVDFKTDSLIQNFLRNRLTTSTLITIAHRINTIKDQDYVILLENGNVKEAGSIPDLLALKAKFQDLYNSQN